MKKLLLIFVVFYLVCVEVILCGCVKPVNQDFDENSYSHLNKWKDMTCEEILASINKIRKQKKISFDEVSQYEAIYAKAINDCPDKKSIKSRFLDFNMRLIKEWPRYDSSYMNVKIYWPEENKDKQKEVEKLLRRNWKDYPEYCWIASDLFDLYSNDKYLSNPWKAREVLDDHIKNVLATKGNRFNRDPFSSYIRLAKDCLKIDAIDKAMELVHKALEEEKPNDYRYQEGLTKESLQDEFKGAVTFGNYDLLMPFSYWKALRITDIKVMIYEESENHENAVAEMESLIGLFSGNEELRHRLYRVAESLNGLQSPDVLFLPAAMYKRLGDYHLKHFNDKKMQLFYYKKAIKDIPETYRDGGNLLKLLHEVLSERIKELES